MSKESETRIIKLAAEFNRSFTSGNSVDVPARITVSRDEWRELYDAICSTKTPKREETISE